MGSSIILSRIGPATLIVRRLTFKDFLTSNPTLAVDVISEPDYGRREVGVLTSLLHLVAYMVGGIMAIVGGLFPARRIVRMPVAAALREI